MRTKLDDCFANSQFAIFGYIPLSKKKDLAKVLVLIWKETCTVDLRNYWTQQSFKS